jgi:hypothetical protein
MIRSSAAIAAIGIALSAGAAHAAGAPVPSGAHPRLFMNAANVAGFAANAAKSGTSAAKMVAACQDAIDHPGNFASRGGADSDAWPATAMACAFAYNVTKQDKYLAPAITYWRAALGDDENVGDGQACTAAASTSDWKSWTGETAPPPVLLTITHDTGYPMRWYGPEVSLVYDWLYNAPGVDDGLRAQTRNCLTAWMDYYTARGYHHDEAGSNYHAGFVVGKTLAGIAIGNDGGADGHLWNETINDVFGKVMIGQGMAGSSSGVGTPAGVMLGGDWGEGWQYGPLSVAEYAAAARAAEENGASLPEMDAWINSVMVRYIYGTLPTLNGQYNGNGDFDPSDVYAGPGGSVLDGVLLGPSSPDAAAWAAYMKQQQKPTQYSTYFWNVLGELRQTAITGKDYRAQTPAPPLWYLSRGTRAMYTRTGWDAGAFWGVFASAPEVVSDHQHFGAGNFVFNRGGDGLIVDSSNYGEFDTHETNAIAVDTENTGDYAGTQTPWSHAELVWARGTNDAVFAARSDFARAFDFSGKPSSLTYANRDWVMLPEGEVVTIDRVDTGSASRNMSLYFHANTGGTLALGNGGVAAGTVGSSALAIHPIVLGGGASPSISKIANGGCKLSCSYPCGACDAARFAVDEYTVKVPGPSALAIHAFDGLAGGEAQATVGSLNDDNTDPAPKQNAGVVGAAVYRGGKQSYVVASSAAHGAAGTALTYGVPGGSAGRHVVFDAPEAADGTSAVTASAVSGRCVVKVAPGSGGGIAGHPLMFQVAAAGAGCTIASSTDVASGAPPPGGGLTATGTPGAGGSNGTGSGGANGNPNVAGGGSTSSSAASSGGGHSGGCNVGAGSGSTLLGVLVTLFMGLALFARRRPWRRRP